MRIKVKNHQIPETSRVEMAEGLTSEPNSTEHHRSHRVRFDCSDSSPLSNRFWRASTSCLQLTHKRSSSSSSQVSSSSSDGNAFKKLVSFAMKAIPCCISVPIENQRVLLTVKRFSRISYSVSHGYGFRHSSGEHRAINSRMKLTVNTAANV